MEVDETEQVDKECWGISDGEGGGQRPRTAKPPGVLRAFRTTRFCLRGQGQGKEVREDSIPGGPDHGKLARAS